MPEMPEVETIRKSLAGYLEGRQITEVEVRLERQVKLPDVPTFIGMVKGRTIAAMKRRGKYLIAELDNGCELILHLRMTGRLIYSQNGEITDNYTRIVFRLDNGAVLIYADTRTLGAVYALAPGERWQIHSLDKMGPEPLTEAFTVEYLQKLMDKRGGKLKSLLLNQEAIGGIGNIYADEALFLAGILPERKPASLTKEEIGKLHQAINKVIGDGIRDGGTTFRDYRNADGGKGSHQDNLFVYSRQGQCCKKCGTPIEKITVGGRGTHFCPNCQR